VHVIAVLWDRVSGIQPLPPAWVIALTGLIALAVIWISTSDPYRHGLPLAGVEMAVFLILWTYVAKRTVFGRHVYAVGGNAEAARRAFHRVFVDYPTSTLRDDARTRQEFFSLVG